MRHIQGTLGILMQYVPGFSLVDLHDKPSPSPKREGWQSLCDDGLRIVRYIVEGVEPQNLDHCIARNSVVHRDPIDDKWKRKLIDFGTCEFREDDFCGEHSAGIEPQGYES